MSADLHVEVNARGDLVLSLPSVELVMELLALRAYYKREALIAQALHEQYEFILPEDIGALTSAPILCNSEATNLSDDGRREFREDARIYWYPNYQVADPWEDLLTTGTVTFTKAETTS